LSSFQRTLDGGLAKDCVFLFTWENEDWECESGYVVGERKAKEIEEALIKLKDEEVIVWFDKFEIEGYNVSLKGKRRLTLEEVKSFGEKK